MKIFKIFLFIILPLTLSADINYNISIEYRSDSINVLHIIPQMQFDTLGFKIDFQPNIKFIDTTLPPKKLFKDIIGMNMQTAYFSYMNNFINIGMGKSEMKWGEGISPLLLSGYLPLNNISYGIKYKIIDISSVYLLLDRMNTTKNDVIGDTSTIRYNYNRLISAHRITFDFNNTKISLSEAALIYYKEGEDFPIQYFNPLNVYYVYQWNQSDDNLYTPTNVFWDLTVSHNIKDHNFYLELLIDDFQYDNPPGDMNEPNHLAFIFGHKFSVLNTNIHWEYSIASRWIYGLYAPAGRYLAYDFPIGTEEGNDFDRIYFEINRKFPNFSITLINYFKRKGEGTIDTTWPSGGGFHEEDFPTNNFLSGNIKYYYIPQLEVEYSINKMNFKLMLGDIYQINKNHNLIVGFNYILNLR